MAHIVTLKDNNDEISYPITPVDAVFVDSNTTLDDALDEKADTDLTNVDAGAVTTAKIADGAVNNDKTDFTTNVATQTMTWKSNNTTRGTTTVTMIPLDNSGLTLYTTSGNAWPANTTSGTIQLLGEWETPPSSVLSFTANAWIEGNVNGYMTYCEVSSTATKKIDMYVKKDTTTSQAIRARFILVGYR